jgi:hypothetical protein
MFALVLVSSPANFTCIVVAVVTTTGAVTYSANVEPAIICSNTLAPPIVTRSAC